MRTELGEQARLSWKPTGPIVGIFEAFQAPLGAQRRIARRVGTLGGTRYLPLSDIERVIEESMSSNGGMPDWGRIEDRFAGTVHDIYRKLRR